MSSFRRLFRRPVPPQKGIIHRDLKPSNVLIAQYDGKPVPKVIDFAPCAFPIKALSFMSDSRSFVVGGPQGQLSVATTTTGQPLFEIANIGTGIESVQPLEKAFLVSTKRVKDGRTELVW